MSMLLFLIYGQLNPEQVLHIVYNRAARFSIKGNTMMDFKWTNRAMPRKLLALIWMGCFGVLLAACTSPSSFPSWHQKFPVAERFEVVLGGEGILDHETGLVWEKAPDKAYIEEWDVVVDACFSKVVGERKGWRVPARYELLSLAEFTSTNSGLPVGHPFQLPGNDFWTATEHSGSLAWAFGANSGNVYLSEKVTKHYLWCVRGGYIGYDVYGDDGP